MDHAAHAAHAAHAVASGTIQGHVAPALLFSFWGLWWAVELLAGKRAAGGHGWYPMDQVMGWSHITIYMGFALSGAVDLLHRWDRVGAAATHAALAGATLNAAFLLALHGNHAGVENAGHALLALGYGVCGAAALWEAVRPRPGVRWVRVGAMLVVGCWWGVLAWVLYRSGWSLDDPIRVLWMYPLFAWTALGVATALVSAAVVAGMVRDGGRGM